MQIANNPTGGVVKVLVVSRNQMICAGIRMILTTKSNIIVVGEAVGARTAIELGLRERPHIVLIDLDLPDVDVLRLMRDLHKATEESLVVLLSNLSDGDTVRKALCSGAAGVVLKVQPPAVLIAAIESLCSCDTQVEQTNLPYIGQDEGKTTDPELLRRDSLTTREREIVYLIGKGLKNKNIADQLCISETTVRHHLTSVFSKLGVSNRQQLLIWAHRYHLVELTQSSDTA